MEINKGGDLIFRVHPFNNQRAFAKEGWASKLR